MDSGWLESRRIRFDASHLVPGRGPSVPLPISSELIDSVRPDHVDAACERTQDYLLGLQHSDGYWVGELEGDTILESEYVLLLAFLGRGQTKAAQRAANYIRQQQLPEGGWAIYPGGPLEISASVKAYFALKITGHSADVDWMILARQAILQAGGAERVNSFTRYYLALLGVISYEQCPAVPPEIVLVPTWMPFNIYEMSAWSRTIVVPLSLVWAHRPFVQLSIEQGIRELFVNSPEELSISMGSSESLDEMNHKTWMNWDNLFHRADQVLKFLERWRIRPLRRLAIRRAAEWLNERFDDSDGLGAIFPPIIWSVVALKCLGYKDDASECQRALNELEKLTISEGSADRLQPCQSPVWDTAIATIALREAGVPAEHPSLRRAVDWLLAKEVRRRGDWAISNPGHQESGWFFEFNNAFYPDVDDTCMVLTALVRCLPGHHWSAEFLLDDWSPHEADDDSAAVLTGKTTSSQAAFSDIESMRHILNAVRRGACWLSAMQNRDGGWGAFDVNNDREILTRIPFADHNAMIDPSTSDLTARVLELFADLNFPRDHDVIQRATEFVWRDQEEDHCWYGRWGVNYIYGTWQALVGLTCIGVSTDDPRICKAAIWLMSKQQSCGGWGETPRSYDDPNLRGQGEPTASQTAWALMGLMAAGYVHSEAVQRGITYLLDTQQDDGTWQEDAFTGTGFPRVFYLKYHLYRIYFPLIALARYSRLRADSRRSY